MGFSSWVGLGGASWKSWVLSGSFPILMATLFRCKVCRLPLCGSGCPMPGQGRAGPAADFRAGWQVALLNGKVADMTLTLLSLGLCPCPIPPTIAIMGCPVRSPELSMPIALLYGTSGFSHTEVPIVAGWQLGLTCGAEEVGSWYSQWSYSGAVSWFPAGLPLWVFLWGRGAEEEEGGQGCYCCRQQEPIMPERSSLVDCS